jgi:prepilin-type N-terminal cleavage/methylation domain-containing protein
VRDSRPGFTLFEVLLVLALIVLLAAITYPSVEAMYGGSKVTAAGDMVRAAWVEAQARAIDEGRSYRFAILPNQGNYRIAPDSPEFWAANGAPGSGGAGHSRAFEDKLPKPVLFTIANGSAPDVATAPADSTDGLTWVSVVTFLPDGTAREDASVTVASRGTRPLVVHLRGLTGVITVKPAEGARR